MLGAILIYLQNTLVGSVTIILDLGYNVDCLQGHVSYYCLNRGNGNGTTPNSCNEATQADIDLITSSMAACFKTAVNAGMDIAISPHLDDGLGLGKSSLLTTETELFSLKNKLFG